MDRDLVLVECNDAYLATVGRTREEHRSAGRSSRSSRRRPTPSTRRGVPRVQRSFERARDTGQVRHDAAAALRHPRPATGGLVAALLVAHLRPRSATRRAGSCSSPSAPRTSPTSSPSATAARPSASARPSWAGACSRSRPTCSPARRSSRRRVADKERAAERVAALAGVALELTRADDVRDLTVDGHRARACRCSAPTAARWRCAPTTTTLRLVASRSLGEQVQAAYGELPLASELPAAVVARTGQTVLLPTRAAGLAWSPRDGRASTTATGRSAWATRPAARRLGAARLARRLLGAGAHLRRRGRRAARGLRGAGVAGRRCASARRGAAGGRAVGAADVARRCSSACSPTRPTCRACRSPCATSRPRRRRRSAATGTTRSSPRPARRSSSSATSAGTTARRPRAWGRCATCCAAWRTTATTAPAVLLGRLDTAMQGLGLDTLATALLARVEPADDGYRAALGQRRPPAAGAAHGRRPAARPRRRERPAARPRRRRRARTSAPPTCRTGSTLVLYTDGLVERRDASLDAGIARVTPGGVAPGRRRRGGDRRRGRHRGRQLERGRHRRAGAQGRAPPRPERLRRRRRPRGARRSASSGRRRGRRACPRRRRGRRRGRRPGRGR